VSRVYRGWPLGPTGCPQAGLATTRDASWYNSPGRARVVHVVADDGGSACCGMPLVLEIARPPGDVELWLRCQRRGCRERWT
jgi:hypothetical protein